MPLSHLSSLVLLILEREICISSRGTGGISFLFCRQVPSFECSSSASWLAFSYFICRPVMYLQKMAKVAVQYHVSLNLETFGIGVCVFWCWGPGRKLKKESECCLEYRRGIYESCLSHPCDSLIAFMRLGNVHYFICNKLYTNIESQHITFILLWISFIDVFVGMLLYTELRIYVPDSVCFFKGPSIRKCYYPIGNSYILLLSLLRKYGYFLSNSNSFIKY